AQGFLKGLERRLDAGQPIDNISSVASFFVSRVDTAVDKQLPDSSPLRGRVAIANARVAYRRFQELFSGPRWERLAAAGARVQRPLWASTGTKNPAYSDVMYVEELVASDTVNTLPEATLKAFLDHGNVRPTIVPNFADADSVLAEAKQAGIDLDAVTAKLLTDGLAAFQKDFDNLLLGIESSLSLFRVGPAPSVDTLGSIAGKVRTRLDELQSNKVAQRIFDGDYTLWKPDPTEISNRLGWIPVIETMLAEVDALKAFAREVAADGYTTAVLLGMGGSSLAPEVLHSTFGTAQGMLDLKVLDTTDPSQILDVENAIDLQKTLFIVASKSGGTVETLSHFAYFWEKISDGRHFVAITDPGTPLEVLATEHNFRRTFRNPTEIGGRYSALSYFGLVPAALIGVDLQQLLGRAHEMLHACRGSVSAKENPGAWLGAAIGEAALAGRDKLTLVMPAPLSTLGYWIEQLIAESTGKQGRGIVPIEGEALGAPEVYGNDRIFVAIGDNPKLAALESAGHVVIRLPYTAPYQLGAEFFRWEFATAVAGHVLEINPFDQPNVQEAKDTTNRILAGEQVDSDSASTDTVLAELRPGDYIAITAYVNRNAQNIAKLNDLRLKLRDRNHVATT
ncbi:MAG: bifunctional transaldolase/phosoglucose isomerase, partial [Tepidiformaceae bacterium]